METEDLIRTEICFYALHSLGRFHAHGDGTRSRAQAHCRLSLILGSTTLARNKVDAKKWELVTLAKGTDGGQVNLGKSEKQNDGYLKLCQMGPSPMERGSKAQVGYLRGRQSRQRRFHLSCF